MTDENEKAIVRSLADTVVEDMKKFGAELSDFKGASAKEAIKNIPDVVVAVEKVAKTVKELTGRKKEVAVEIINRFVDIPLIPESGEALLIGLVIDAVVAAFNRYGKTWLDKLGL